MGNSGHPLARLKKKFLSDEKGVGQKIHILKKIFFTYSVKFERNISMCLLYQSRMGQVISRVKGEVDNHLSCGLSR